MGDGIPAADSSRIFCYPVCYPKMGTKQGIRQLEGLIVGKVVKCETAAGEIAVKREVRKALKIGDSAVRVAIG